MGPLRGQSVENHFSDEGNPEGPPLRCADEIKNGPLRRRDTRARRVTRDAYESELDQAELSGSRVGMAAALQPLDRLGTVVGTAK